MNKHSLFWATAGHLPAYLPAHATAEEFKTMQPNATYAVLADTAVFDPSSKIAGVASPIYDGMQNSFVPADQRRARSGRGGQEPQGRAPGPDRSKSIPTSLPAGSEVKESAGFALNERDDRMDRKQNLTALLFTGPFIVALSGDLHLSDHPDGASLLHGRSPDRTGRLDRASRTMSGCLNDRQMWKSTLEHRFYFVLLTVIPDDDHRARASR